LTALFERRRSAGCMVTTREERLLTLGIVLFAALMVLATL
jgi:hypothetical protein